jgi:hypothetical protein
MRFIDWNGSGGLDTEDLIISNVMDRVEGDKTECAGMTDCSEAEGKNADAQTMIAGSTTGIGCLLSVLAVFAGVFTVAVLAVG